MKRILLLAALAVALTAAVTSAALAERSNGYDLTWNTIDSGGGASAGGGYTLTGTIGQPDAGSALTGGNFALAGGFWSGVLEQIKLHLPVIFKNSP